ncbi:MAG: ComEA family DNA-binding protein [Chloroflexi bacterium]|nr:ComEA family DNA-binding protein [Chloroflexota bacterium]
MSSNLDKYWLLIVAFLLISLITGSTMLVVKQSSHKPVEISLSSTIPSQYKGDIYIGGAVANPGFYPLREGDTVEALIQTAGTTSDADLSQIKIYVPKTKESQQPQKISLNRAEIWLLNALPGIGPDRAQAIVDYRNQHGPFKRIEDLLKVAGIGSTTLDRIRELVTVED